MSFADFPEQQRVVALLQRSLDRGRLAHAYLFAGADLITLENMAATLAKALNCQNPPRRTAQGLPLDSCDQCLSCRKTADRIHPDVQWIRPESKSRIITIDQVREVMQSIYLKPTEAPFKVAIFVAAERLNVQAANAFLKTLEEPPARSILLLLSTDPQQVLETIVSRCLRLNFSGVGPVAANSPHIEWLRGFAQEAAAPPKGLLGQYKLLGTLLARLAEIKSTVEKSLTDQSPLERYEDIEPKLKERWEDELTASIEAEYRRRRAELLALLQSWMRDIWIQTLKIGEDQLLFPALSQPAQVLAGRISAQQAMENLRVLEQLQRMLGSNVQEALALEVGFLKLKM
jgi:DNA polymerase III subunit delta'